MAIEDLIAKQAELMLKVPHTVRPDSFVKMEQSVTILDVLLRYLSSTGHKPWRPDPLSPIVQQGLLKELNSQVTALQFLHRTNAGANKDLSSNDHYSRQLISAFGVIEETIEYVNSLSEDDTREHRLEELVDVLFFYMEQILLGEFTWEEIEKEYRRKWEVNIERYRRAEQGDYGWDKRGKGVL